MLGSVKTNILRLCFQRCLLFNNGKFKYCTNVLEKYSKDDETKILNVLNVLSEQEIAKYKISNNQIGKLIERRSESNFQSLEDIFKIKGIANKMMEKMFDNILNYNSDTKKIVSKRSKLKGQYLEPNLTNKDSINSVTGIFIHFNNVCWATIEKDAYLVTDWNYHYIESENDKNMHLCDIVSNTWSVYNKLPKSDIYVMQSESTVLRSTGADANNPKMIHVNLQKAQFVTSLSTIINTVDNLNNCATNEFDHKVYYLRPTLPARLFKTLVGNERVSALPVLKKLINNEVIDVYEDVDRRLLFSESCKKFYLKQKEVDRELMSQTMLLLLAFLEVCIFDNKSAICKMYDV